MEIYEKRKVPETVALVAMGDTRNQYAGDVCRAGSRFGVADETWVINKLLQCYQHDLVFRMDDLMQTRKCNEKVLLDKDNIPIHERFDKALREHDKPIITSIAYPDEYPMSVEYPLENIINRVRTSYFQTTPAYAVAFAIYIGVKKIKLYGCDYTYREVSHTIETGRANLEHMLTIAIKEGIEIEIARKSTLMNTNCPVGEYFYGYGGRIMEVLPDKEKEGNVILKYRPDLDKEHETDRKRQEFETLKYLMNEYRDVLGDECAGIYGPKIDAAQALLLMNDNRDAPQECKEEACSCNTHQGEQICQHQDDARMESQT